MVAVLAPFSTSLASDHAPICVKQTASHMIKINYYPHIHHTM